MSISIVGIIPARYGSTRFPGKPLAMLAGKSVIQRVWEQCQKANVLQHTVIATDDERIKAHAESFGAEVVMTRADHQSGTDRCYEAYTALEKEFEYIINIQGDEPFLAPEQLEILASLLNGTTPLATLVKRIEKTAELENPNVVKAVLGNYGQALYFSRSPIPYYRNVEKEEWVTKREYYKHIGIYAYRSDILKEITQIPPAELEQAESLEQLRWLSYGLRIRVAETTLETIGIDTPEDLEEAAKHLAS